MGLSELNKQKVYELEEYGSGLFIMDHNEGRESYYRLHDSQISPAWMDPENSTALPNLTEDTTSSPDLDVITSSPHLQWLLQSSLFSQSEATLETFSSFAPNTMPSCPCLSQCYSPDPSWNGAVGDSSLGHANKHETDHLEHVKTQLEEEIAALERERERLELVFEAHMPICKLNDPNPE
ncbi:proto-oncogene c-Fos isoform X2 [Cyprinus carpio]|uniref:Proto-oncogene c-Fos isoform X2 n=1 Tax=Cyprinus carpio TaxID=7962 RepID=A0A9Q9ZMC8_CYPCA|nr:proto-oncogene c-Fos isoform X2 [Cyprinus carpio]